MEVTAQGDGTEPYKVYHLDKAGRIITASWVQAESDDQALLAVAALAMPTDAEVWHLNRMVALVPAHRDPTEPSVSDP